MPSSFFSAFEMYQWAGSAMGNPIDPLDACKSWLEVDRVYFPICINPHQWVLDELWMDMLSLNLYENFRSIGAVNIIDFVQFEELMDQILLDIGYWNHMDFPVQKVSLLLWMLRTCPNKKGCLESAVYLC
ncbi:unnamed protein product [Lactuca saligna]|uniref:Uncharacterized protein n=1 Tax=Lactuca saligna TaxID=75948 RepID=A0AA35Y875_LACSI|nr:unnamed protein product [Lactuca saligna]